MSSISTPAVCPHCGAPVRPAMIRCRECDGIVVEDFVLAGDVQAKEALHRCRGCDAGIDPGETYCPKCASQMLDGLLSGPPKGDDDAPLAASELLDDLLKGPPKSDETSDTTNASDLLDDLLRGAGEPEQVPLAAGRTRGEQGASGKTRARSNVPAPPARNEDWSGASAPREAGGETVARAGARGRTSPAARAGVAEEDIFDYLKEESPSSDTTAPRAPRASIAPNAARSIAAAPLVSEAAEPPGLDAACAALIASLSSDNIDVRCKSAEALGTLNNSQAIGPLERLMADPEIRVRRIAAEALIQLGHPKGAALREIAAKAAPSSPARGAGFAAARAAAASRPRRSVSLNINGGALLAAGKYIGGGALALGLVWMIWSSGLLGNGLDSSYRSRGGDGLRGMGMVTGRVQFAGSPLDGAIVEFHPAGGGASAGKAVVSEGDSFVVKAEDGKGGFLPGLKPGDYQVTIAWPPDLSLKPPRRPIPEKYAAVATSGFTVPVKEGINHIPPFELTP